MRRGVVASLALAGALALAACSGDDGGSGAEPGVPAPDPGGSSAGSVLRIEVLPDTDAEEKVMTLTCDPAGGDHPNPQAACDALAEAGPEVLEPVPQDEACTLVYGGPQVAAVTGTIDGEQVRAAFSRSDGCEIERWDALGTEFFDVPLQ